MVFYYGESILKVMIGPDKECQDLHHKSYFLPDLSGIGNSEFHVKLTEGIDQLVSPFPKEGVFFEGNMEKQFTTIPINLSTKPDVI